LVQVTFRPVQLAFELEVETEEGVGDGEEGVMEAVGDLGVFIRPQPERTKEKTRIKINLFLMVAKK